MIMRLHGHNQPKALGRLSQRRNQVAKSDGEARVEGAKRPRIEGELRSSSSSSSSLFNDESAPSGLYIVR